MKKLFLLLLLALLPSFGFVAPLHAAESASPYDSVVGVSKDTTSTVDAIIDGVKDVNKATGGQLADFLKNTSIWKKLSENSQSFITNNLGKLGPWVKKIGWVANALDLAPSIYNTITSFNSRDKQKFKESFRDVALKTGSVIVGLGIGAAVSAALPAVVAATAATGGAALLIAAGGAVVTVGAGMLADHVAKKLFSKSLEDFGGKLYDKLIGDDTLSGILDGGGSGNGSGNRGGSGSRGSSGSGGAVTLDKLQW